MKTQSIFRASTAFLVLYSLICVSLPFAASGQAPAKDESLTGLSERIARIEAKLNARRAELGIPGMSLAIVKDGRVVLSKGYGFKSVEEKKPVTADTQFAIGSATKAFTALSVLMSRDQGKLDLDDSPKKHLPYFKINDPEIDKNITVKNLLTHSSGLNRTDLGWITGKLTREETNKVAGEAKPMGKLGEKFLYQNVMYAAAGEIVSKVQNKTWEAFAAQDILKPLEMMNSTVSVPEMQKSKDFSLGYEYNFDTKVTKNLPTRDLQAISPAGSINSTSSDMAKWLQFILNKGELNGQRLITKESFEDWIKPEQKVSGNSFYALGWFVQEWKGKTVIQHGGNIDGFNSMVALIPEENLGFVLLTNVSASSLGSELMPIVWENMLGELKPETADGAVPKDAEKAVGKYKFAAAGFDIEVKIEDGNLVAVVPGQPTYILEKIEGRRYKLSNAPEGFFITFDDNSALLEQPQGNFTLPKEGAGKSAVVSSPSAKELIGLYGAEGNNDRKIEIKEVDGSVSLVVGMQSPYPLVESAKDIFKSPDLPESYSVRVVRGDKGNIAGIVLAQPEGEFAFTFLGNAKTAANPKEIFGSYKLQVPPAYVVDVVNRSGKTYLEVPNQPPYLLESVEKDVYFSPTIPDVLKRIEIKRDDSGNITGFVSNESSGIYEFKRIEKPKMTADELMPKVIEALGGEAALRKITSRITKFDLDLIHQGVKGSGTSYAEAPDKSASYSKITAFGKEIGTTVDYFDGTAGGEMTSFSRDDVLTGQRLKNAKYNSDFYGFLNWKENNRSVEVRGTETIEDEEAFVVRFSPKSASDVTYYFSKKTFLPVRVVTLYVSSTSEQKIPIVTTLSDYRKVDGVMVPFKTVTANPGMGDIVSIVKEIKHNEKIDPAVFKGKR